MGTAQEPAAKRPRLPERDVQTMGWLTESTTQPRRHRFVAGAVLSFTAQTWVVIRSGR